ncbi:MAG: hypothetical protein SGPRY_013450 [Prymnesium sp.]
MGNTGESPDDWKRASADVDDARIAAEMDANARSGHGGLHAKCVDDRAVGNENAQEVETEHGKLFSALEQHYILQWEDKAIKWPRCMKAYRQRVDNRPKESGGRNDMHDGEYRHAFVSESEYSDCGESS